MRGVDVTKDDRTTLRRMRAYFEQALKQAADPYDASAKRLFIPGGNLEESFTPEAAQRALQAVERDQDVEAFLYRVRAADGGVTTAAEVWALITTHLEGMKRG